MSDRYRMTVTLPPDLVERIDKMAKKFNMDRSHFMEWFLEKTFGVYPDLEAAIDGVFREFFKGKEVTVKEKV